VKDFTGAKKMSGGKNSDEKLFRFHEEKNRG
jgi:hypothetical protein